VLGSPSALLLTLLLAKLIFEAVLSLRTSLLEAVLLEAVGGRDVLRTCPRLEELLLLLEGMYPPYVSLLMDVLENFSLDSPNTSGGLY